MTKTTKALPILLDRLDHALKAQNISLKRSALLEIAAGAFGYRNSNELTAAAKKGEINPPYAEAIGRIELANGESIIVGRDTLANAPYAIDEAFLEQVVAEERREEIGVTPYGHLVRLENLLDENIETLSASQGETATTGLVVGVLSNDDGNHVYLSTTGDGLIMQIAQYCRENWESVADYAEEGENPHEMTDSEIVDAYFDICSNHDIGEYFSETHEEVIGKVEAVPEQGKRHPDRYEVVYHGNDKPIDIVDHKQKDSIVAQLPVGQVESDRIELAHQIAGRLNGNIVPEYIPDAQEALELQEIIRELREGVSADIWYDAHEFMDEDDEDDPDTMAFNSIERLQGAIENAAQYIEKTIKAGKTSSSVKPAQPLKTQNDVITEQEEKPVWITDTSGAYLGRVRKEDFDQLGIGYHDDNGEIRLLTPEEQEINKRGEKLNPESAHPAYTGASVLYRGRKLMAVEIDFPFTSKKNAREEESEKAFEYAREKEAIVERLGGHVLVLDYLGKSYNKHLVLVMLPYDLAKGASDMTAWREALSWLVLPDCEKKTEVMATFIPQVDMGRSVVSAEPLGETQWDATFDVLMAGREVAERVLEQGVADDYAIDGLLVPDWIQKWIELHPFDVEVEGLEDFFKS